MDLPTITLALLFLFSQKDTRYFYIYFIVIFCVFLIHEYNICNINELFTPISNESIQSLGSVYNGDTLTVSNIKVTGNIDVSNGSVVAKTITTNNLTTKGLTSTDTITIDKRNSDWGPNLMLMAPKKESAYISWHDNTSAATRTCYDMGVYRTREGAGDFQIDVQNGNLIMNGKAIRKGGNRLIYEGLQLGIQSARTGYLSDQGGWKGAPQNAGSWETMNLQIPSFVNY